MKSSLENRKGYNMLDHTSIKNIYLLIRWNLNFLVGDNIEIR